MHTLIILICCFGFFMLYNTSQKAKLSNAGYLERWVQERPRLSARIGLALIVSGIIAFVVLDGVAIGAFAAVLLLMASSAYIIAIAPFFLLKLKHVVSLAGLGFLLEIFIF